MTAEAKSSAQDRAAAAQTAIRERHLHPLCGWVPGTRIGAVAWPPAGRPLSIRRLTASWNYWWQAHLVDLLVDGAVHRNDAACAADALALLRGIRLRNLGRWTNHYYDDMAWLGLAIERADRHLGPQTGRTHHRALGTLTSVLLRAWAPELGGGIPWRTTDTFFNAPANGPAAILLARTGHTARAAAMTDWIDRELRLPSGLIADGLRVHSGGDRELVSAVFTYCQGVTLGAEVEAYRRLGGPARVDRIDRLLTAVAATLAPDGVITGAGGGDGGLFAGILARNLALVATDLPAAPGSADLRARARSLVLDSAEAAWAHRAVDDDGLPVFGPDWNRPAVVPRAGGSAARKSHGAVSSSSTPERDLSVQISAGILLEAAVSVTIGLPEHTGSATPD